MIQPKLFNRVFPWFLIILFVIVAPLLIYYTAGYRYNAKKGELERNGTLIVDSTPKGATIFLDDKDSTQTTPYTFQNVSPGVHKIRVTKTGYQSWEKSLDVRPEMVTFANTIRLWRADITPTRVLSDHVLAISSDPARDMAAILTQKNTNSILGFWTEKLTAVNYQTIKGYASTTRFTPRWRDDGHALLINGLDASEQAWTSTADIKQPLLTVLPPAEYHWDGTSAIGVKNQTSIEVDPKTQSFTQNQLATTTLDLSGDYSITRKTAESNLVLEDKTFLTKLFVLPSGAWRFGEVRKPNLFLYDQGNWLVVNTKNDPPAQGLISGDYPRTLQLSDGDLTAFMNQNEIWYWKSGASPVLLLRTAEPLIQTRWHNSGSTLFVATAQEIMAIDMDDRQGRLTNSLAKFDQIYDFDLLGKNLYVAGRLSGQDGVWQLIVE